MKHSHQDALDTAVRRASAPNHWHPLLAARESEPGIWLMVDSLERCYGIIRMLRRGNELGYRAVTWAPKSENRLLIGYFRSLRAACEQTHRHLIQASTVQNHPQGLGG